MTPTRGGLASVAFVVASLVVLGCGLALPGTAAAARGSVGPGAQFLSGVTIASGTSSAAVEVDLSGVAEFSVMAVAASSGACADADIEVHAYPKAGDGTPISVTLTPDRIVRAFGGSEARVFAGFKTYGMLKADLRVRNNCLASFTNARAWWYGIATPFEATAAPTGTQSVRVVNTATERVPVDLSADDVGGSSSSTTATLGDYERRQLDNIWWGVWLFAGIVLFAIFVKPQLDRFAGGFMGSRP